MQANWIIQSAPGKERLVVDELAAQLLSDSPQWSTRLDDIKMAVGEACLNAMEHGNGFSASKLVKVTLTVTKACCTVRAYDEGSGVLAVEKSKREPERCDERVWLGDGDPRGWGLMFIYAFADSVTTGFENGCFYIEMQFKREAC